jgi:hypothetical protein
MDSITSRSKAKQVKNTDSVSAYLSTFNKPVIKKAPKSVTHSVPHVRYMHALENP